MSNMVTIIVADDHPLLRQGLVQILSSHEGYSVVGEASNGLDALQIIKSKKPDIAILDVQMPVMDGYNAAQIIVKEHPETRIIFLTMFKEEEFIRNIFEQGIKGYILKESALSDIVKCIDAVMKNEYFVSPEISQILLKPSKPNENGFRLTAIERQVLKLIAEGKSTKEIAQEMFKSQKTIDNHRSNICKKLGITGNSALIKYALKQSNEF